MSDGMGDFSGPRPAHAYELSKEQLQEKVREARELLQEAMQWTGVDPTADDAKRIHALEQKIRDFLRATDNAKGE